MTSHNVFVGPKHLGVGFLNNHGPDVLEVILVPCHFHEGVAVKFGSSGEEVIYCDENRFATQVHHHHVAAVLTHLSAGRMEYLFHESRIRVGDDAHG